MYRFLCGCMFSFLLARIDGSYGNSIFNHLKGCQIVFQSGCNIFTFPHERMLGSDFFAFSPAFLAADFLILVILMHVKWYFVVLFFISLIPNYIKCFFSIVFLFSILFISILIFILPFLLLTLGFVCSFSSSLRYKVKLLI